MFRQHAAWRGATWTLLAAALALPSAAQARLDNSPGVWPGGGMCVVSSGDRLVGCGFHGPVRWSANAAAKEKRAAASVSTATANAMQAGAVAHGEANSVLSNPYIEQKVTTPESVGVNHTRIPAGGF